jgi:peptidoglycan hydrolase CwlO-like protein
MQLRQKTIAATEEVNNDLREKLSSQESEIHTLKESKKSMERAREKSGAEVGRIQKQLESERERVKSKVLQLQHDFARLERANELLEDRNRSLVA